MEPGSVRAALGFAAISLLTGCADHGDASPSSRTEIRGHVIGNMTTGDTTLLGGVRVVAREFDRFAAEEPQFHADSGSDSVIAETVTAADGSYALDLPSGWVSLVFEHEGFARTYRTENTSLEDAVALDVTLALAPEPLQFEMPQPGDPDMILGFDSESGRENARLRVEPGDLVMADGSPIVGRVTAYVDAAHTRDRHKDAFWSSSMRATKHGPRPFDLFGMVSVDLFVGDERVRIADGATIEWNTTVAAEQRRAAEAAWEAGELTSYSLDTRSGLWVEEDAELELADGVIRVERTHFSTAAIGTEATTAYAEAAACVDPGRHAVILLTLSNPRTPTEVALALIKSAVAYVSQVQEPKVLVVLDDNHNNEFVSEAGFLTKQISAAGYVVDLIDEPKDGITESMLVGYDVVWLTNPGYPLDDQLTLETLAAFREAGHGFVVSGDDVAHNVQNTGKPTTPYTFLTYQGNGTSTCGYPTDNNNGASYLITFKSGTGHPLAAGLEGVSFTYGDDIDHSAPVNDGEHVLAWATLDGDPECTVRVPVVMALDLGDSKQRTVCSCKVDNDCLGSQHCVSNECQSCSVENATCQVDGDCCSGLACNGGMCGQPCGAEGETCVASGNCCGTLSCLNDQCLQCVPSGSKCGDSGDCCDGLLCMGGACGSCKALDEECTEDADCCDGSACELVTTTEEIAEEQCHGARELTATVRDFHTTHPDFEWRIANDLGIARNTLGATGKPVYGDHASTTTTHSAESFAEWFRDVDGVNMPIDVNLTLSEVTPGVYQYLSNSFFPIDGKGFGNEGNSHNYHFTLELHTEFVYRGGETFTFTGDDDLFAFINGQLAIDLGGVHASLSRTVDLDQAAANLGITKGNAYSLDIFFAERHTTASNFRIDTTIACLTNSRKVEVQKLMCVPRKEDPIDPPDDGGDTDGSDDGGGMGRLPDLPN